MNNYVILLITPEHQTLQDKHQKLVLRSMQFDMITAKKREEIKGLLSEVAPLKRMVEQLVATVGELLEERTMRLKMLAGKDRQLQKMDLLQHQYNQL